MAESVSKNSNPSDDDQSEASVSIRRYKCSIRGDAVTELLSLRVRECIMFSWLVLAAFFSLALISYDKVDPGWSHVGSVQNLSLIHI